MANNVHLPVSVNNVFISTRTHNILKDEYGEEGLAYACGQIIDSVVLNKGISSNSVLVDESDLNKKVKVSTKEGVFSISSFKSQKILVTDDRGYECKPTKDKLKIIANEFNIMIQDNDTTRQVGSRVIKGLIRLEPEYEDKIEIIKGKK